MRGGRRSRRARRAMTATAMALVAGIATPASAGAAAGRQPQEPPAEPPRITVTTIEAPAGHTVELLDRSEISDRGQVLLGVTPPGGERWAAVWDRGSTDVLWPLTSDFIGLVDMSERGHVVGFAPVPGCVDEPAGTGNCQQPTLWSGGDSRALPYDTPIASGTVRVSDQGHVVAANLVQAGPAGSTDELVAWRRRGRELVRAPATTRSHQPGALNDHGQVVVMRHGDPGTDAFFSCTALWQVGGPMTELSTCQGFQAYELAVDITSDGQVLGLVASFAGPLWSYLWQDGRRTELAGHLLYDLNDRGEAVGLTYPTWHAALWREGTTVDLGTLGGARSQAVAINEHSQIVGWSQTADGEQHAFLWEDGRLVDLGAAAGAETSSTAVDINDRGQVLGTVDGRPVVWTVQPG
jgi:probable HAF family extracellular repeat protein